jgi:lipoyl(octanoyl) transferase
MNESTAAGAVEMVRVAMTILEGKRAAPVKTSKVSAHVQGARQYHNLTPMSPLPSRWAIWRDGAADGVTNMATDAALLSQVRTGHAVWRWYAWERPTVSFGRHERTAGRYSAEQLARIELPAVRRPTGGRALLHAREITYSVTCPLDGRLGWRVAYDAINAILLATLHDVGVPAELAGPSRAVTPDGPVCFDEPAEGEITVRGQKLVGSAVWRQDGGYLQHGSILLHDDQHRLSEASLVAARPPAPAAALARIAPGVDITQLADALERVLSRVAGEQPAVTPEPFAPSADVRRSIALQRRHFADTAWLWRR